MSMLVGGSFFGKSRVGIGITVSLLAALVIVSGAAAEQVRISDSSGNLCSVAEIPAGSVAAVRARVLGGTEVRSVVVSLEEQFARTAQTSVTNETGFVEFGHVAPGAYLLKPGNPQLTVADVKVIRADTSAAGQRVLSDDHSRNLGKAMYVAGASAIAGIAGFATVLSGSSSSSGSTETSNLGFVNTDGVITAAPDGHKPQPQIQPSGLYDDVPPNPGTISPAPNQGTVNGTPPAHGPFGPDAGDTGSGGIVENPPGPGQIAPAPPITNPMTPS
jgi:hypothetical protein